MPGRVIRAMVAAAGLLSGSASPTAGASPPPPPPSACYAFQRTLTAEAYSQLGLRAPVATLAAQVHQESSCNPSIRSRVGAAGLAQFMPATAQDLAARYPRTLAPADPLSPPWALRAMVTYDRDLLRSIGPLRAPELSECSDWWLALRAYNGGLGWVNRERRLAAAAGADPDDPIALEAFNAGRSAANHHENTTYPRRIIWRHGPRYERHGWGRNVECPTP